MIQERMFKADKHESNRYNKGDAHESIDPLSLFLIFNYLFKFNFRYFIKLIVFKNISVCVVWNRYNANTTLRSEFEFEFDPQNIVLRGTKANPREYVTEKLFHVNVCFPFF